MSKPKEFALLASGREHGFLDTILPWSVAREGLRVIEYTAYEQEQNSYRLMYEVKEQLRKENERLRTALEQIKTGEYFDMAQAALEGKDD